MFDHYYYPVALEKELNKQLEMFQYQAQMLVDGQAFLDLSNKIIKAQVRGKYFELIILLPKGYRTLENANLIHRIANAGAKVGVLEVSTFDPEVEQFSIFDSKLFFSNRSVNREEDLDQFFIKKRHDFDLIMNACKQISSFSDAPKITFSANKYFVYRGDEVKLSWKVENSNSVFLDPGNKSVDPHSEETLFIQDDCLFTITSKNVKSKTSLSIFIKCYQDEDLKLVVLVFNKELGEYIKIDPAATNEPTYAVYFNDLVRIEWVCKARSKLFEAKMGKLDNIGFYDFIIGESIALNFELHANNEVVNKNVTIQPIKVNRNKKPLEIHDESLNISDSYAPKQQSFIHAWIKKIVSILKLKS
ncbi:hypothetical protein [Belliella aquatica]|uniref:TIR domain-containing protein n=1 Tax=Belliella aquatica TaxID=1323734 RepID=A0ABQ1MAY6_9BACT|nr:hypothetical protein [Belliella aquatica]MCH7406321.1 hypothetical protein [Belliella aquatica]GGC37841.1 hypothetical protein GCM10010993_15930 [Belliella aquatica]